MIAYARIFAYHDGMDETVERMPKGAADEPGWTELVGYFGRAQAALETALAERAGLSICSYEALAAVERAGGQLQITHLARWVGLTGGGCSRLVQRLVETDLIERCPCPTDRRVSYACLTERGRTQLAVAHEVYKAEVERLYGRRLSLNEKREVARLFGQIQD